MYHLVRPIRAADGTVHLPSESLTLVKKLENMGKELTLFRFEDSTTTFLFEDEFVADNSE